jgi:hypothetical protein
MKVATRTFSYIDDDGVRDEIVAGRDRIADDHPLARAFPGSWREEGLEDELKVRSAWVAEMRRAEDERRAPSEPLSRAGRAEREELRFWSQVDQQLHRDDRSSEERREADFYDRALTQIEDLEAAATRRSHLPRVAAQAPDATSRP